jgi:hypothetical protein
LAQRATSGMLVLLANFLNVWGLFQLNSVIHKYVIHK